MRGMALALALAVLIGQPAARACSGRVDLAAITAAMADPAIDPALLQQARDLRTRAAKAIDDGRASDGNMLYRQLMSLLKLDKPSMLRC